MSKKNQFGNKKYRMKDHYYADNLIVARLQRVSSLNLTVETTNQKYIFEPIYDKETIKYREVFTGFMTEKIDVSYKIETASIEYKYLNIPYVYELEKFTNYFPELKGKIIPKLSLIWFQNDINYCKDKNKVKEKKKKQNY